MRAGLVVLCMFIVVNLFVVLLTEHSPCSQATFLEYQQLLHYLHNHHSSQVGRYAQGADESCQGGECRCTQEGNILWFCDCLPRCKNARLQDARHRGDVRWSQGHGRRRNHGVEALPDRWLPWHLNLPTPWWWWWSYGWGRWAYDEEQDASILSTFLLPSLSGFWYSFGRSLHVYEVIGMCFSSCSHIRSPWFYLKVDSHSRSLCQPLWHFDDLTIFLHFCRSSASPTHAVIPMPVHFAMYVSQVLFYLPLAPFTKPSCASEPGLFVVWPNHWSFLRRATSRSGS